MAKAKTKQQLTLENEELRARLQELEETLEAIRSGSVDAIVASGPAGDRVYTLEGADHAYHMMVESMNEGAVTLMPDGTVLYGNRQFVQLTGSPPSDVIGRRFHDFVHSSDQQTLDDILDRAESNGLKAEIRLRNDSDAGIPVQIAANPIDLSGARALTLVITDLSAQKRYEEIVAAENLSRRILEQAQEAIAVCIDGCIVRANRAFYEICGCSPLMQLFDLVFPLRISESEMFSAAMPESGKTIRNQEVRYQRPDGRIFNLILNAGPLVGREDKVLGSLISLVDITERKRVEERLRESEIRFREMAETVPEIIFTTLPDASMDYVNERGLDYAGLPAGDAMGDNWMKVVHPEDLERSVRSVAESLQTGQPYEVRQRLRAADGSYRWFLARARAIRDEKGRILKWFGNATDIHDMMQAEKALRAGEEQVRVLIQNVQSAVALINEHGALTIVNRSFLRMFELAEDADILNINSRDWGQWQVFDEQGVLLDVDEHPVRKAAQTGRAVQNQLIAMQAPGSTARKWILISAEPILDAQGRMQRLISTYHDITERKLAEEELRASEERLRFALETCHIGAWDLDLVDHSAFRSLEHDRIFGYAEPLPQWTYEMFLDHVLPEDRAAVDAKFRHATDTQGDWSFECRIRRADGEVRWIWAAGRHRADATGASRRMAGIVQDITERKQADNLLQTTLNRFYLMLASMYSGVLLMTEEGRIEFVNQAFCDAYGLKEAPDDLKGLTSLDLLEKIRHAFVHPDQGAARIREILRRGQPVRGEEFAMQGGRTALRDFVPLIVDGKSSGRLWIHVDITELKQAEADLLKSEESLRLANEYLEQRVRERTMDLQNLTGELERSRHELRDLVSELVLAEERERKRIAGVLHDEIAQTLAAARMRLDLLQGTRPDPRDAHTLQEVKAFLAQSIQETRALMSDVGNPLLFDMGLKAACESLAERLMKSNPVRILCDIREAFKNLDPDMKTILYQVVRELLTNVVKHSRARNAQVLIDLEDGHFRVQVTDDGVGFDPGALGAPTAEGGFGLYSIRERLLAIDGTLGIRSNPGAGTEVTAIMPAAIK